MYGFKRNSGLDTLFYKEFSLQKLKSGQKMVDNRKILLEYG